MNDGGVWKRALRSMAGLIGQGVLGARCEMIEGEHRDAVRKLHKGEGWSAKTARAASPCTPAKQQTWQPSVSE